LPNSSGQISEDKNKTSVFLDSSVPVINPYFISGFADGATSFSITLIKNNKYKQG